MRTYKLFNSDKSIDVEIITDGIKGQKEFTITEWPPRNYNEFAESIGIDWNIGAWNESTLVEFAKAKGLGLVSVEEKSSIVLVDVFTPPIPVESISFEESSIQLIIGEEVTPVVVFTPNNATNKEYTLSTESSNITINGKEVSGVTVTDSPVTLTATSQDGNKIATTQVSVVAG